MSKFMSSATLRATLRCLPVDEAELASFFCRTVLSREAALESAGECLDGNESVVHGLWANVQHQSTQWPIGGEGNENRNQNGD